MAKVIERSKVNDENVLGGGFLPRVSRNECIEHNFLSVTGTYGHF